MQENNKQIAYRLRKLADQIERCKHEYHSRAFIYSGKVLSIGIAPLDEPSGLKFGATCYAILLGDVEFLSRYVVANNID